MMTSCDCIATYHGQVEHCPLHAAAPDLLAALQVLVLTPHILYYLEANDRRALKQAQAAIAKATSPQAR